jgi:hypothetical protein
MIGFNGGSEITRERERDDWMRKKVEEGRWR